jgi:hypothetical protein
MPAINPPRLKIQATELIQSASDPDAFCRSYHVFLDLYADRTYRPGKIGAPPPLLRAYQAPKPVERAVEKELGVWAADNRKEALKLADALWLQPYLEFRLTAASLIGQVFPLPVSSVLSRVEAWIEPSTEDRLVKALVNSGLKRILNEYQDLYVKQVDIWLRSRSSERNRLGLIACPPLFERREFDDYPLLFNRLRKLMRSEKSPFRNEILIVIQEFAARTPDETAFFLEKALRSSSDNAQIAWYIRSSLSDFPPNTRSNLREVLVAIELQQDDNSN